MHCWHDVKPSRITPENFLDDVVDVRKHAVVVGVLAAVLTQKVF